MVWYFEDRWITRLPVSHIPLTILGLMSWCSTLKMDGFSYLLVFLQLIPPYSSAAVCCTLISSQIFISREVWFLQIIGCSRYQPSGHSKLIFSPAKAFKMYLHRRKPPQELHSQEEPYYLFGSFTACFLNLIQLQSPFQLLDERGR